MLLVGGSHTLNLDLLFYLLKEELFNGNNKLGIKVGLFD